MCRCEESSKTRYFAINQKRKRISVYVKVKTEAIHPTTEVTGILASSIKKEWAEADLMVRNARFTWTEMMEILEEAGGVITFNPVGRTTLFSRYSRYGHLICTIGLSYYRSLEHVEDEQLSPFRDYTYVIDSFYSSWNNRGIAKYLRERSTRSEISSIAVD